MRRHVVALAHRSVRGILDQIDASVKLEILRRTIYNRSAVVALARSVYQEQARRRWERGGRVGPAPAGAKYARLRSYGLRFGVRVLVETGAFVGDSIYALRNDFDRIISIELDPWLAARCQRRFAQAPQITILQGDSARVLPDVLAALKQPALFWLDAHWSGGITARAASETPVSQELRAILQHTVGSHVVLVDDALLFGSRRDYPTLETIQSLVHQFRPEWVLYVEDGILCIHRQSN